MDETFSQNLHRFKDLIEENSHFRYFTRSTTLQKDAVGQLNDWKTKISEEKARAVEFGDEDQANLLLGYECVVRALVSEIEMCILLKDGDPDAAWNRLINSQDGYRAAGGAHQQLEGMLHEAHRLESIEKLVFPPQNFSMSFGFVATVIACSICEGDYAECEHIKGKAYMGEFCYTILNEIELHEVSIVTEPADKLARIVLISTEEGMRNCMTWEITSSQG